jgi:coenzyme Q-binding protein COQ10
LLSARAERLLPYPAAALFDLAADLEQYPRFLTGWISARIYERQADLCYAEQVVGFGLVRMRFRSKAELCRPERIEVTSDDAQFRRFQLLWRFRPGDGGCQVALSVELELRSQFVQGWIDRLAPAAPSEVLYAFEQRARESFGPAASSA